MRIDKWIWAVNLLKNRTHATNYCKQGKVYLDGVLAKPSKNIKVGQKVKIKDKITKEVIVKKLVQKPVKKDTVLDFYELLSEEVIETEKYQKFPKNNKTGDFKYKRQKDGEVSKKDKRARQKLKNWEY